MTSESELGVVQWRNAVEKRQSDTAVEMTGLMGTTVDQGQQVEPELTDLRSKDDIVVLTSAVTLGFASPFFLIFSLNGNGV